MKALTFHGRRDIRLEDLSHPAPGEGEVLVRVTDCVLSQGIIDVYLEGHFADLSQPHPRTGIGTGYVVGQQFGGIIEAVGPGVPESRVGEMVGVAPGVGCGECASCKAGRSNHCDLYVYHGLVGANGGLAEYAVVPSDNAPVVPRRDLGYLLEGLLVVYNLSKKVKAWLDRSDEPVLILGAGPIGLSAGAIIRDLFDREVVIVDLMGQRRERARQLGFDVRDGSGVEGTFEVVLDCAGTNPDTGGSAMLDGLERVAKGGVLGVVGTYVHETSLSVLDMLMREVAVVTSFAYDDDDLAELLPQLSELKFDFGEIAETLTIEQVVSEGLLRGEIDRDSFTALVIQP